MFYISLLVDWDNFNINIWRLCLLCNGACDISVQCPWHQMFTMSCACLFLHENCMHCSGNNYNVNIVTAYWLRSYWIYWKLQRKMHQIVFYVWVFFHSMLNIMSFIELRQSKPFKGLNCIYYYVTNYRLLSANNQETMTPISQVNFIIKLNSFHCVHL